jgi:excinuclease ABC subunit C
VTFHRTRRNADRLRGELARIPGIGEKTAAKLLRHFGSLDRVREVSEDELAGVIGKAAARKLRAALPVAADAATQLTILE